MHNVLARLNAPKIPEQAETAIHLTHVPKADTARYDRLRATQLERSGVHHE